MKKIKNYNKKMEDKIINNRNGLKIILLINLKKMKFKNNNNNSSNNKKIIIKKTWKIQLKLLLNNEKKVINPKKNTAKG